MKITRRFRIEGEIKLILHRNSTAHVRQRHPASARGVTLRQFSRMGRQFISDDARFDILTIRQSKMLFGGNITQHGVPNQPIIAAPIAEVM